MTTLGPSAPSLVPSTRYSSGVFDTVQPLPLMGNASSTVMPRGPSGGDEKEELEEEDEGGKELEEEKGKVDSPAWGVMDGFLAFVSAAAAGIEILASKAMA